MKNFDTERSPLDPPEDELGRLRKLLKRTDYARWRQGTVFDEELFFEAYTEMMKELREMSPEQRKDAMQEMYFDSVPPSMDREGSRGRRFIDERVTEPVILSLEEVVDKSMGLDGGMIAQLDGSDAYRNREYVSRFIQYGPVRVVDVIPGDWAIQKAGEFTMLGSSEFSACQAVIARNRDHIALAHSLYGCEDRISLIVEKFRRTLGQDARLQFFYPQQVLGSDTQSDSFRNQENVSAHNARYQQIAVDHAMESVPFYYVDSDYNPNDVGGHTILVTQDRIRVIGNRMVRNTQNGTWERQIRTIEEYNNSLKALVIGERKDLALRW